MPKRASNHLVFVAALLMPVAAVAQTAGGSTAKSPAVEGRALVERLCISCHLIDGTAAAAAASPVMPVGPPSFPAIANMPGQTAERIRNVLIRPHAPMPDMQLTNAEITNIVVYLETLKAGSASPPPAPEGEKPKPPARS